MRNTLATLAVLALLAPLTACGDDGGDGGDDGGTTTLTVFAAASLTATFEELATDFEADHAGVDVKLGFGGSSDLVAQIQSGAPADVFASADTANMDKLTAEDLVGDPQDFASNTLEIAVPPDNPADVTSLQDATAEGVDLVVCAPEVPCGAAAQKVADAAGITLTPVSEEQSVTDVLAKVTSGEADAGLVYVTDVAAAGDAVLGVDFPESADAVNTYPIATLADSERSDLAAEFVALVTGTQGQDVLREAGFGAP